MIRACSPSFCRLENFQTSAVSITNPACKDEDKRHAAKTQLSKHTDSEKSIVLPVRLRAPVGDSVEGQANYPLLVP